MICPWYSVLARQPTKRASLGANFRSDSRHARSIFSLWDDLQIAMDNSTVFKRSPPICPYLSCLDRPPFGPRLLYLITTWRRINPFSPSLLHIYDNAVRCNAFPPRR